MHVHWFQHVPYEGLGCIAPQLLARGHRLTHTPWHAGGLPPGAQAYDALIVMGGPMNVDDTDAHPWLEREKTAIRATLDAGKPVLGICLGAQLIAQVLGAAVTRNPEPEIGWFEVRLTAAGRSSPLLADLPERFTPFHWHGDTFGIPEGAGLLAASAACAHQAFQFGERVLGLQFHLEITAADARQMYAVNRLSPARWIEDPAAALAALDRFAETNRLMQSVLARWLGEPPG